jgi:hypothetical protein
MGRQQIHASDHPLRVVVIKPVFTWLEAGDDGMSSFLSMFRGVLVW